MRSLQTLAFVVVAVLLLGADNASKDTEKLQGTWRVTATEFDGRALSEGMIKDRQISFKDDKFAVVVGGVTRKTLTFKLDPSQKPPHIDMANVEKQETAHGIYVLETDELKLCYGEPGGNRPTEFASPAGQRVFLIMLKRDK